MPLLVSGSFFQRNINYIESWWWHPAPELQPISVKDYRYRLNSMGKRINPVEPYSLEPKFCIIHHEFLVITRQSNKNLRPTGGCLKIVQRILYSCCALWHVGNLKRYRHSHNFVFKPLGCLHWKSQSEVKNTSQRRELSILCPWLTHYEKAECQSAWLLRVQRST